MPNSSRTHHKYVQITQRTAQLRGELKSKLRPHVKAMYSFSDSSSDNAALLNRKKAESLRKQSGFAYKVCCSPRTTYYVLFLLLRL